MDAGVDGAIVQVYNNGSKIVYRASALGSCTKALVLARLEYDAEKPPESFTAFDRGHRAEKPILDALENDGWVMSGQGQLATVLEILPGIIVSGHLDELGARPVDNPADLDDPHIIEAKSQNQAEWDYFHAHPWESALFKKYKWQISSYMLSLGMPCVLARGLMGVDDEGNECVVEVEWQIVEKPFYTLADIRRRILQVEALARQGIIPDDCDNESYPCPYFKFHQDREVVDDEELDFYIGEYQAAQEEEEEAKERLATATKIKRDAQTAIVNKIGEKAKVRTPDGTKITTWKQAGGQIQYDTARMKEDGIDVDAYKKKRVKGQRVKITGVNTGVNTDNKNGED